jgi:hypothetical protein
MKVAIMQPYFLPYIGYFQLIKHTDLFILFDDVQYIRHGWLNRNRILKPEKDWQYIIAPLQKHNQTDLIKDIKVLKQNEWKFKIFRQIEHYKKKSPFYDQTKSILEQCFNEEEDSITKLNANILKKICDYIGIPFNFKISSDENYNYFNISDSGEWALRISEQIGATSYVNPVGGKELFDSVKFKHSNIDLCFLSTGNTTYSQRRNGVIEANLSIIDVMMFNSPEQILELLNKCKIQKAQ